MEGVRRKYGRRIKGGEEDKGRGGWRKEGRKEREG